MGRKLLRSKTDRIIAGVCGGIGEYFDLDSTLVRLLFILVTIWGGAGIIIYVICWILIPDELVIKSEATEDGNGQKKEEKSFADDLKHSSHHSRHSFQNRPELFGLIVLLVGLMFLMKNLFSWFNFDYFWPVLLIVIGIVMIATSGREKGDR